MCLVSMRYEDQGRTRQKQRTRDHLLAVARELIAEGVPLTVDAVAARAAVSRATAYRYFPDQRALLAAAHPETRATSLLPDPAEPDPFRRLAAVVAGFTDLVAGTEAQQRTMLRLSLSDGPDTDLPLRQGRAIGWISEALEPVRDRLAPAEVDQLVRAIRACCGIESLVWLTDVAGLDRAEARVLMRWSAEALLRSALAGSPPPTPGETLLQDVAASTRSG